MGFLDGLTWLECGMTITCRHAGRAGSHPLSIIDAILKFGAGAIEKPPLAIFHPLRRFDAVREGESYAFDLVFPHARGEEAQALLDAVGERLSRPRNNFVLESVTEPREERLSRLVGTWDAAFPVTPGELVLDFASPVARKHVDRARRFRIDGGDLFAMLIRRVERIYGDVPADEEASLAGAWAGVEPSCAFLEYKEYHHGSKSGAGVQYVHGLEGPMLLRGVTRAVVPLLLLCSRMNVGARLHLGQGAYRISTDGILGGALASLGDAEGVSREAFERVCLRTLDVPLGRLCRRVPSRGFGAFIPSERLSAALDDTDIESVVLSAMLPEADRPILKRLLSVPKGPGPVADLRVRMRASGLAEVLRSEGMDAVLSDRGLELPDGADMGKVVDALPACGFRGVSADDVVTVEQGPEEDPKGFPLARTVHVVHPYAAVGVDGDAIVARSDGERIARIPFGQVDSVVLHGAASVSTAFLRRCASKGVPVILCDANGYRKGSFLPESPSFRAKARDHVRAWDGLGEEGRLVVAKTLVEAKILSYACRVPAGLADAGGLTEARDAAVVGLRGASDWQEVLGFEGAFAALCHRLYNGCVVPDDFRSERRDPGRKPDRWNALVDVASSLAYSRIGMEIRAVGLDPCLGFLHRQHSRFETLTADLQEQMRADVDRWLIRLVNARIVHKGQFFPQGGRWMMTSEGMRVLAMEWERFLQEAVPGQPCTPAEAVARSVRSVAGAMLRGDVLAFYDGTGWTAVPEETFAASVPTPDDGPEE